MRLTRGLLLIALLLLPSHGWAAPTITGTISQVNNSASSGSTSVTVPADATCAVLFWSDYDNTANTTLSTKTLNGVAFTTQSEISTAAPDQIGVGVATLVNPATGTQTFAWGWSAGAARDDGGGAYIVWVKDCDTSTPVHHAQTAVGSAAGNVTVTVNSATTDLLLAMATSTDPTNPVLDATNVINNNQIIAGGWHVDLSNITPGASTTAVNMTGEDYSTMAAITIQAAAGGGGTVPRLSLMGVGP